MAVLHIRNVPDALYARAQELAAARGETLSAMVVDLLQAAADRGAAAERHMQAIRRLRRQMTTRKTGKVSAADLLAETRIEAESRLAR
ncbi:MAG: hypothetical protein ABIQ99_03170 [Thermoflexales bacterium]